MLYNKIVVKFADDLGNLAIDKGNTINPQGHNVTFDLVPSYPDGIQTKEELKEYFEEVMEPLANAGWSIKVLID